MNFDQLGRAVSLALDSYQRDARMSPSPEHLEIRLHPEDMADVIKTCDALWMHTGWLIEGGAILGIPMKEDPKVDLGHPEIVSTWKWVL